MTTYQFKGAGYGLPYSGNQEGLLTKRIDIPAMIAAKEQSGLALTSAPNVGVALPSTGFGSADILEVFWVPKGTVIRWAGIYVITSEGATGTIGVGVTTSGQVPSYSATGFGATWDLDQAAGYRVTSLVGTDAAVAASATSGQNTWGTFIKDGSLDITFNTASTDTAVFIIWATYFWLGTLV